MNIKTLRVILIILLVLYGLSSLTGAITAFFFQNKQAEWQHLGELTPGVEKVMIFSGALMVGQVWLYFSALALLSRRMPEGYMYAVTLGFIELFQAIAIIAGLGTHGFGKPTDYFAILKGLLLLVIAIMALKRQAVRQELKA